MKLVYREGQKKFEAEVLEVDEKDYIKIKKSKQFLFDWTKEKDFEVFKIVRADEKDKNEILGLISLINFSEELRIHISLIESSNDNKGKDKKVEHVAGCLLAFAVQLAFSKGYLGFVSLVPKTELIDWYVKKYGFKKYGRQLAIERKEAINLIQKYL